MEDNVREAELKFMADLRTIIKRDQPRPRNDRNNDGTGERRRDQHPGHYYYRQYKQLSTRWGIIFLDDRIINTVGDERHRTKCIEHFGHPGETKMLARRKDFLVARNG